MINEAFGMEDMTDSELAACQNTFTDVKGHWAEAMIMTAANTDLNSYKKTPQAPKA